MIHHWKNESYEREQPLSNSSSLWVISDCISQHPMTVDAVHYSLLHHEFEWGLKWEETHSRASTDRQTFGVIAELVCPDRFTDFHHYTLKAFNNTDTLIRSLNQIVIARYQQKPCFHLQNLFRAGSDRETKAWNANVSEWC